MTKSMFLNRRISTASDTEIVTGAATAFARGDVCKFGTGDLIVSWIHTVRRNPNPKVVASKPALKT
jgi:hypothetical protein